jgi:membrane protease YdiL (CAAX protease family)
MRKLSVWGYVAVVVIYLAIIQGLGLVLTSGMDTEYASAASAEALWRGITVPVAVSLVFTVVVVSALRWWRPALRDDHPVRSWTIAIVVLMAVGIVLGTNYAGLAERGIGLTLLLLLSTLMVGFTEELMFRGVGITVFRANGFSEGKVALWTCVIFGLAHATNLFAEGMTAFVQVLVTAMAGYFFYLIRRRTGGLLVPALVHGLWDFALISATVVPDRGYIGTIAPILILVTVIVVVLVRRRHIEPAPA